MEAVRRNEDVQVTELRCSKNTSIALAWWGVEMLRTLSQQHNFSSTGYCKNVK